MALLLAASALWIAAGFGRSVLARFTVIDESSILRFAYSGAVGFGIAAYAVWLIGLCGQLSYWPVTFIWVAMACLGWRGIFANTREVVSFARQLQSQIPNLSLRSFGSVAAFLSATTLFAIAVAAIIACYKPPGGLEWDAISYHLADPAQFLLAHRVFSIPTEHHSNFPLLMEMLYTMGLLYSGYALANMMHLITAVLTIAAVFACSRRLQGSKCAWVAVLLFASTPVVFWESSVAYVEMALGLYTTLAALAVVRATVPNNQNQEQTRQWLLLCAICAGLALGVKYLAVIPFGLLLLIVAFRTRSIKSVAIYGAAVLVIGSPWYIKNAILLHNPVYPFYYKLFPKSVYWSAGRAMGYDAEQSRFGTPHSLKEPVPAASNLMQAPWDLMTLPLTKPGTYSNDGEFSFLTLIGGLVFAFNGVLLVRKRVNKEVTTILLLGAVQLAVWFFVSQVSRYLVSVLPLLAISGACGISGILHDVRLNRSGITDNLSKWIGAFGVLLLSFQVLTLFWIMLMAPLRSNIVTLPKILEIVQSKDGVTSYLRRYVATFAITDWINKNTPGDAGVLLYDDTFGFYINRRTMWANEAHSAYIPYATFADGHDLTEWMVRHNYRYALFNMNWAPQYADKAHPTPGLEGGPKENESAAFQTWYASAPLLPAGSKEYRWRGLVADAYKRGLWTDLNVAQNGVVLLRVGPREDTGAEDSTRSTKDDH